MKQAVFDAGFMDQTALRVADPERLVRTVAICSDLQFVAQLKDRFFGICFKFFYVDAIALVSLEFAPGAKNIFG